MNMNITRMKDNNMLSVLNAKVTDFVRLPLSVSRGTEAQRYQKAQEYSDKLARKLDEISGSKSCKSADFILALKSVIAPHKINFSLKNKVEKGTRGTIEREVDYDKNYNLLGNCIIEKTDADVVGYNINLELKKKDTVIKDKANALHEARHMFDYMCNPKSILFRSFKFVGDDTRLNNYKNTYDLLVNKCSNDSMSTIKKQLKENLSQMSNSDGIDTLQSIRRGIRTELNAYNDGQKYMKKHPLKYGIDIVSYWDYMKTMKYNKKLEYVNKLLAEKLQAERNALREKYGE